MKNWTLGKRIFLNSVFLCAVIVGMGMFAATRFIHLNRIVKEITEDSLPG